MIWNYKNYIIWKNEGFPIKNNVFELHLRNRGLRSLKCINNLINLRILDCSYNDITLLEDINNLTNLKILDCSNNEIRSLEGINNVTNLEELYCDHNKITSLLPINNLISLRKLHCYSNKLTSLEGLTNLNFLQHIEFFNNQIEYIAPNFIRFLNLIGVRQHIYDDKQNVHNHNIQECIRKSIQNILNIKPVFTDVHNYILNDNILNYGTKQILIEYINCKDIHLTLNVTFKNF